MTRKSDIQPALAYDYRRAILFAQVMSITDAIKRYKALKHLGEVWGIDEMPIAPALARHALRHAKDTGNDLR